MLEQLEKVLEKRTTVKYFDGNPIPTHLTEIIKKSVAKTPSCNNTYNFRVKVLGQSLEHRKAKVDLHNYICTVSKRPVNNDPHEAVSRPPRSWSEVDTWKKDGNLKPRINGQTLAPLLFVWYVPDSDPTSNDLIDLGLSCWNTVVTAEALGVQTGFCACFNNEFVKEHLNLPGLPLVMLGFGFASSTMTNQDKHYDKPRPSWNNIIC